MKKTFTLTHPKTKYARLVDAVRNEVKKYLKRERGKALPEGFDVWDFDCKFGPTAEAAELITVAEIGKAIQAVEEEKLESFYLEILAKPALKAEIPRQEQAPVDSTEDDKHDLEPEDLNV